MLVGFVAIALALVFAVAMIFRASGRTTNGSVSAPTATGRTPTAGATEEVIDGPAATATSSVNVRSGPSNGYVVLGVLRRGSEAKIVGRSDDGDWLEIEYPAHSNLLGWIIASSVDTSADLAAIPVSTPEDLPMAIVPTDVPVTYVPEETAAATQSATSLAPTPTPSQALPDLVVGGTLVSGGTLVVTVTNQGKGALKNATIEVGVFDATGAQLLKSASVTTQNLSAGASIDVQTGYVTVVGPDQVLVIVDPNGKIKESDDTNNRLLVSFAATPTLAPTAKATTAAELTPTPHP
ncbi:MAG: CARDB domain-containing protein [Dehalococcoidia bacterium]|jgi:hypothetical protein